MFSSEATDADDDVDTILESSVESASIRLMGAWVVSILTCLSLILDLVLVFAILTDIKEVEEALEGAGALEEAVTGAALEGALAVLDFKVIFGTILGCGFGVKVKGAVIVVKDTYILLYDQFLHFSTHRITFPDRSRKYSTRQTTAKQIVLQSHRILRKTHASVAQLIIFPWHLRMLRIDPSVLKHKISHHREIRPVVNARQIQLVKKLDFYRVETIRKYFHRLRFHRRT